LKRNKTLLSELMPGTDPEMMERGGSTASGESQRIVTRACP